MQDCFLDIISDFTTFAPDGVLVPPDSHRHAFSVEPPFARVILKLKSTSSDGGFDQESLLKCVFRKSGEASRVHPAAGATMINLVGSHELIQRVVECDSEITLETEEGCTMRDVLDGKPLKPLVVDSLRYEGSRRLHDRVAGRDLFYIGVRGDDVLPSKTMWDLIVAEVRVIYTPSKDDCALEARGMTIDNVCGTIPCLAWSHLSPDLVLHTAHGTVRFNREQGLVNFRGVRNPGALVRRVIQKYAKDGAGLQPELVACASKAPPDAFADAAACHVNMVVLTVCTGRCHLVTRDGSLLETMLLHFYTKSCIHVFSRSEMSGNLVKFSVRSWEAYAKRVRESALLHGCAENVERIQDLARVRNHVCTVSSSGFVMIRFFWKDPLPWSKELEADIMAAAECLREIVCVCS